MKIGITVWLILAFLVGVVAGEHKTCTSLKGSYSWDYGTCIVKEK